VGDWFEYGNVEFNWTSNDPNAKPPSQWIEMNGTDWMRTTVQEISGTNIKGQMIAHYTNGSETTEGYVLDVDTGQGNATTLFIAANLVEGDPIYTDPSWASTKINETIFRAYLGQMVEVNHLNLTILEMEWPGMFHYILRINLYWYKSSGALCELQVYYYNWTSEFPIIPEGMPRTLQEYESSLTLLMEITAMVPEFPAWTSILLILTVLTFVAVVYKRKIYNKTPF